MVVVNYSMTMAKLLCQKYKKNVMSCLEQFSAVLVCICV